MRNSFISLIIFLIGSVFCGCTNGQGGENDGGAKKNILENKYLKLGFVPDSMGRLNSIEYKPSGFELLMPYEINKKEDNPLFSPRTDNERGIRELYWGRTLMRAMTPMSMEKNDDGSIRFYTQWYANTESSLARRIQLEPDSTCISIETQIQNNSDQTRTYQLWLNMVLSYLTESTPVIPSKGGEIVANKRKYFWCQSDSLIAGDSGGATFTAPARSWLAFAIPSEKIVFAFSSSIEFLNKDGFFFSWQGIVNGKTLKTIEVIMNEEQVAAGGMKNYRYSLLVFPGMSSIKEIHAGTGIDAFIDNDGNKKRIVLKLCPSKKQISFLLKLFLKNSTDKIFLKSFILPELPAGVVRELSVEVNEKDLQTGIYSICAEWGNFGVIELLEPKLNIK